MGGGDGSEKLFTRPPGPPDPEEAVDPLTLWSSLPQPQGHMVINEAAGLNAGALYFKEKKNHNNASSIFRFNFVS